MNRSVPLRPGFTVFLLIALLGVSAWWWNRPVSWEDASHPPPPFSSAIDRFAAGDLEKGAALVKSCLRRYRAPAWEGRIRVLAAYRLASADEDARILSFLPAALETSDPLFAYAELYRARGFLAVGDFSKAVTAAERAAGFSGFPAWEEAIRLRASALEAAKRTRAALALLDASSSPDLHLEAARFAMRAGDREGARRRLVALILESPPGDPGERALSTLEEFIPDPAARINSEERKRLPGTVRAWKDAGRAQAALELLRKTRDQAASPRGFSPDESLAEAEVLVRLNRPAEVGPLLTHASQAGGETADGARYLRVRLAQAGGRSSGYRAALADLATRPRRSRWCLQAQLDLARFIEEKPSLESLKAYRRYREAAGSSAEPIALWREAWIAYELARYSEADLGMVRVLARPDSPGSARAAALYWSARRLEQRGRSALAEARYAELLDRYRNHYYGMLAAQRLHLPSPAAPDLPPRLAQLPPPGPGRRWLEAARALRSVGLADAASAAYRAAYPAGGARARAIALEGADAALDAGSKSDAIQLVQLAAGDRDALKPEELPLRYWQLLVPRPSGPEIVEAAKAAGLGPGFVASVVLEESAFNPLAVSRVGARGLLQLMPATGAEVAQRLGVKNFHPDRLFEPALNLQLGCTYLNDLIRRLGSVPVALAAYNAGAARAVRWALPGDAPDFERYVERIPIPDTRTYVKRILANIRIYRIAWPPDSEWKGT